MAARRKAKSKEGDAGKRPAGVRASALRRLLYATAAFLTLAAVAEVWAGAAVLREGRSFLAGTFGGGGIDRASVDLFTLGVRLSGIAVPQQGAFHGLADALRVERLDLRLDWRMALSPGVPRIRRVEALRPTALSLFLSSGDSGFEALAAALERARGGGGAGFDLGAVRVLDGTLLLQQVARDRTIAHTLSVRGIDASFARVTALAEEGGAAPWSLAGRVGEAGARLEARGTLTRSARPAAFSVSLFSCEGIPLVEAAPFVESLAGCRPTAGLLDLRFSVDCRDDRLEKGWVRFRLRGAALEGVTPSGRELAAYVRSARGDVEEEFGLGGTWDAPEVETAGFVTRLVWRKVGGALGGVLGFPLRLLGNLAGGE